MKGIKLTNLQGKTRGGMQWDVGITHTIEPNPKYPLELCTETCLHFYPSPEIAAFMYPAHYISNEFLAWTCEAEGEIVQDGTKCGCQKLTITGQYTTFPEPTKKQRTYFGILCALKVCDEPGFVAWANEWIDGTDRSTECAYAAHSAAAAAAYASSNAAYASSNAAAYASNAAYAAYASSYASNAASYATYASYAAFYALRVNKNINLQALAEKALAWNG